MTLDTATGFTLSWCQHHEGGTVALRLIGGWGNRSDSLLSCAERLQRSIELMPPEPGIYRAWGVWQPQGAESHYNDLVAVDIDDVDVVQRAIASTTERVNAGPMTMPGQHIEFAREGIGEPDSADRHFFGYSVRAGFVDAPEPFNHVLFQLEDSTDESVLSRYLSALVLAWEPDSVAVVSRKTQRAQGHKPPQAAVGLLTYVRTGTPLDVAALDDEVAVVNADGGTYITIPGTPESPSMDHIRQVRAALGYPNP